MTSPTRQRRTCANGDGNPIHHPSKVICKVCMEEIGNTMRKMLRANHTIHLHEFVPTLPSTPQGYLTCPRCGRRTRYGNLPPGDSVQAIFDQLRRCGCPVPSDDQSVGVTYYV